WRKAIKLPLALRAIPYRLWPYLPYRIQRLVVVAMSQVFVVGVAAVVTDERGRVLVLKHSYRPRGPWGFPAGNVQRGERFETGLPGRSCAGAGRAGILETGAPKPSAAAG